MPNLLRFSAAGLLLALSLSTAAHAGPWTRSFGQVYAKLSQGFNWSLHTRDSSGSPSSSDYDFFGATTAVYAEIGLLPGFQAQLYVPFAFVQNRSRLTGTHYAQPGFGDALVGVQWSPPKGLLPFLTSARLDVKIPMYDPGRLYKEIGIPSFFHPALGDGQIDVLPTLSAGGNLKGLPLFAFIDIGLQLRTTLLLGELPPNIANREYSHGISFGAQLGWNFWQARGWLLLVSLRGNLPFFDDPISKGGVEATLQLYLPLAAGWAVELSYDPQIWAKNSSFSLLRFSVGISFMRW